jgi:hypothetical protein
MMRPEWAELGTCTTIPSVEFARWAVGELLAMRAFQLWGNATTIPLLKPAPLTRSSPPKDTWCGLVEQWIAGTHTALESVNGLERFAGARVLAAGFGELPPVDLPDGRGDFDEEPPLAGVPPPAGAAAPPGLEAADPGAGWTKPAQSTQAARIAVLAAIEVDRLWASALATNYPFCASWPWLRPDASPPDS